MTAETQYSTVMMASSGEQGLPLPAPSGASSECSVNQAPGGNDAGPSNAGPSNAAPADSPWGSFPSVPSSLTPLPPSPYVPSLDSLEEENPSGREQPDGAVEQSNKILSNLKEDQHQKILSRIATFTPKREFSADEIDTIICLKEQIINSMGELDPNRFWAEQRNNKISDGILKGGKSEYTVDTLLKHCEKLRTEGQNAFFFKQMIKMRENFENQGLFY